jgi:hypothetical protein
MVILESLEEPLRRIPLDTYFGLNRRVGWGKSDLITEVMSLVW